MNLYHIKYKSEGEAMVAEVFALNDKQAVESLDLSDTEKKTARIVDARPYMIPQPGQVLFVGTMDEYDDYVEDFD